MDGLFVIAVFVIAFIYSAVTLRKESRKSRSSSPKIDDVSYHTGSGYPSDIDPQTAGSFMAFFFVWNVMNSHTSSHFHDLIDEDDLMDLRLKRVSPNEFFINGTSGKLSREFFLYSDSTFIDTFYNFYIKRLEEYVDFNSIPTPYHIEDTWVRYDEVALIIETVYDGLKA